MKKKQIIQKEKEFTEIINKCPYKKNNYFVIYYRNNFKENRYGISVPTKTGKANVRNKIKRRIKNIIDQNKNNVQTSFDYVIIIRKRILELDWEQINVNFLGEFIDGNFYSGIIRNPSLSSTIRMINKE